MGFHDRLRLVRDVGFRPESYLSQTSIIFAVLVIGFFVFITIKGELPQYAAVIGL